jgi:sigma-B regulation protein RsbU (phosphoserine phosphatase)
MQNSQKKSLSPGPSFNGLRVLIVDDYENMRRSLVDAMKELGMNVAEATNGVEAMALLNSKPFDLVLTDIVMPEMDGFELCEEIRKHPRLHDIPIVAASTHYDSKYIVKALRMGADDYVPKPVNRALVAKVLQRVQIRHPFKEGNA